VQRQIDLVYEDMPDIESEPIPLITISTDKTGKDVFKTNVAALEELKKVDT